MIELYTAGTPNGWKVTLLLEEAGLRRDVEQPPNSRTAAVLFR